MAIRNRVGTGWWGRGHDGGGDVAYWRIQEIKQLWREACEGSGLCQRISTPSGWTVAIPRIGQVTLGDPTSMTVRLRAGQLLSDIDAVAPRIAYAMGIGGLRVTKTSAPMWARVELLDRPEPDGGVVTPFPPPRRPVPTSGSTSDGPDSNEAA
jgi:hypothetical protein